MIRIGEPPRAPATPPPVNPAVPQAAAMVRIGLPRGVTRAVTQDADYGDISMWREAWDGLVLNPGVGLGTGLETAGALMNLVYPELGEGLRQAGISTQDYLKSKMSNQWQEANEKSWLDLSKQGALRDPRAWLAGLAQNIPYAIGTGFAGVGAKLGVQGVASLAGRKVAESTARKVGFATAGAGAGAGEASGGFEREADKAGLSAEERRPGQLVAGGVGAVAGAAFGTGLERLTGEAVGTGAKALARRVGTGMLTESVEEAGTQAGTEFGKLTSGMEFSGRNIAEAAVGGAAIGGLAGPVISHRAAKRTKEQERRTAEQQAADARTKVELDRIKAEDSKRSAENDLAAQANAEVRDKASAGLLAQAQAIADKQRMAGIRRTNPDMPLPMGEPQGGVIVGQGATQEALEQPESQAMFVGEEGRKHLSKIDEGIARATANLDRARAAAEKTGTSTNARVKAKATFKRLAKELKDKQKLRDDFMAKSQKVTEMHPDLSLEAAAAVELDELNSAIDTHMEDEAQEEPPVAIEPEPATLTALDAETARSQRASAGAVTKRAKRVAAETPSSGPGAPPTGVNVPSPQPAGGSVRSGSAEKQALGSRPARVARSAEPSAEVNAALSPPEVPQAPTPAQPEAGIGTPAPSAAEGAAPPPTAPPSAEGMAPEPVQVLPPELPGAIPQRNKPQRSANRAPSTVPFTPEEVTAGVTSQTQPEPTPQTVAPMTEEERAAAWAEASKPLTDPPNPLADTQQTPIPSATGRVKSWSKMTPPERIAKLLRGGPQNVNDLLAAVQDAFQVEKNSSLFRLVQRLRRAFPTSRTKPNRTTVEHRTLSAGFQGIYDPSTDKIYLDVNQAEDLTTAFLHEVVHAATITQMRLNPNFAQSINRLMGRAEDAWFYNKWTPDPENIRGFRSAEEFIAQALTNFDFFDKLDTLYETGSQDKHGAYPKHVRSFYSRLKGVLGSKFKVHLDPLVNTHFDMLLNFIPDGTYLQEGNRQEEIAALNRLGLTQPVALMASAIHSTYRRNGVRDVLRSNMFTRVWSRMLPMMGVDQIVETYGDKGLDFATLQGNRIPLKYNTVNRWGQLIRQKAGFANREKAIAAQMIEMYRAAVQEHGPTVLDNMMYDSRIASIHPDLPPAGASLPGGPQYNNAVGVAKPGGMEAHRELAARWAALSPKEQEVFKLLRDGYARVADMHVNDAMVARLRGLVNVAAGDLMQTYIDDPSRTIRVSHAGLNLEWQKTLTANEVVWIVGNLTNLSNTRQHDVVDALNSVQALIGRESGPYFPLRRTGSHYSHVISPPQIRQNITRAQFDAMVHQNRQNDNGDMEILESKEDPKTKRWTVKFRHVVVQASDSEAEALDAKDEIEASFRRRNLTFDSKAALGIDHTYQALGLQSQSVRALQDALRSQMGGTAGDTAAHVAMKFYLEKLPDTSVRKSQLQARKISGASRSMLHVLSSSLQGSSYYSAQMKYGAKLSHLIGTEMKADIDELHKNGATAQANDLTKLQRHFTERDTNWNRLAAAEGDSGALATLGRVAPQMAGAWLLTGFGTAISNAGQVPMFAAPWFSAKHGLGPTTRAIWRAYSMVYQPIGKESVKEFGRGLRGLKKVGRLVKGVPLPPIRDTHTAMYQHAMAKVTDPMQRRVIERLADEKQIDFGMVADLQSLSEQAGRTRQLFQHVTETAHVMMQGVETMNRMVTALASYDLNKAKVTADVTSRMTGATQQEIDTAVEAELVKIGAEDLSATQFNYGYETRPLWMQKDSMRWATTFKMYPQNVFYRVLRSIIQSINPDNTPAQRSHARKVLGGIAVTTFTMSGFLGWMAMDPFYAVMMAVMAGLTDDDDPETALRKAMQDWVPEWIQTMALHGVPYALGVDASRMGLPSLLPVDDFFKVIGNPDSNYGDYAGLIGEFFLGAPGSNTYDVINGAMTALGGGDYAKAFTAMTPKAFGVNDFVRAWSLANSGATDTQGRSYVTPEELGWQNYVVRFLGFQPSEVAAAKAQRDAGLIKINRITNEREELLDKFGNAQIGKDFTTRDAALQEIKKFNKQYPTARITRSTLVSSVQNRRRGIKSVEKYGIQATNRLSRGVAKEMQQVYQ